MENNVFCLYNVVYNYVVAAICQLPKSIARILSNKKLMPTQKHNTEGIKSIKWKPQNGRRNVGQPTRWTVEIMKDACAR